MRDSISAVLCGSLLPLICTSAFADASDWTFTPSGQLQHDASWLHLDNRSAGHADLPRRTRLGFGLDHASGIRAKWEWDFIAGTITDSFIELPLTDYTRIRIGQYKQPFAWEELISDREPALLETSMPTDAFALARRSGIALEHHHSLGLLTFSRYFGHVENLDADQGWALRSTWAHHSEDAQTWHVAVAAASDRDIDGNGRLRARQELRAFSLLAADSGNLSDVLGTDRVGLEQGWLSGPWAVQSEQMAMTLRRHGDDIHAIGGYLQLSWTSGDALRSYKDGLIRSPKLTAGHAWEVALRASSIDVERGDLNLGQQTNLTAGVNLYLGLHWRLMLNQTWINGSSTEAQGHHTSMRIQIAF